MRSGIDGLKFGGKSNKRGNVRFAFSVSPFTAEQMQSLPGHTLTDRLENVLRRYEMLRSAALLDMRERLSAEEWAVIVLALQECDTKMDMDVWRLLSAFAYANTDWLERVLGLDARAFSVKVRDAGELVSVAMLEVSDRYWSYSEAMPHEERLLHLGVITKEQAREWGKGRGARLRAAKEAEQVREVSEREAALARRSEQARYRNRFKSDAPPRTRPLPV